MRRKLIQLAKKTLVVSLPSKWVRDNGLEKGDEIELDVEEKSIVFRTDKAKKQSKITLDVKELGTYNELYIAYLYQAGIDEIRINYEERSVYEKVQNKIPHLMGYEVIDQGENYLEIKSVSAALEEEFETILRRTFFILEDFSKSGLEAVKAKEFVRMNALLTLENTIDKFTDFCKRVLNKKGYKNRDKTTFYYVIIRDMEKIGDLYYEIISYLSEKKIVSSKETLLLYEETNKLLSLFHKLFYKFDKEKADEFQTKKTDLKKKAKNLMETVPKNDLFVVYNLLSLVKMIGNLYGPYYITTL